MQSDLIRLSGVLTTKRLFFCTCIPYMPLYIHCKVHCGPMLQHRCHYVYYIRTTVYSFYINLSYAICNMYVWKVSTTYQYANACIQQLHCNMNDIGTVLQLKFTRVKKLFIISAQKTPIVMLKPCKLIVIHNYHYEMLTSKVFHVFVSSQPSSTYVALLVHYIYSFIFLGYDIATVPLSLRSILDLALNCSHPIYFQTRRIHTPHSSQISYQDIHAVCIYI